LGLNSEPASSFAVDGLNGEFPNILTGLSEEPDLAERGLLPDPWEENLDGRNRPFEVTRLSLLSDEPDKLIWLGSILLSDLDRNERFIWLIFFILIYLRIFLILKLL
jgi:hypothetical protein